MPFLLRFALAFGAGWLGSYAMPPTAFWPLLLPAVSLLILLLLGARGIWSGFALAWAYGFAFHLFGLSWIGEAFLVDAARFGWMRPFAVSGLPAGLALLTGLAGMAFVKLRSARPVWDAFLFAVLFSMAEWLRGHILTGFPWNLPVQAWDQTLAVLQGVAWIGPYGLSLLTVAAAAALVPLLAETGFRRKSAGAALLLAPIAVLAAAGGVRLATAPAPDNLPMVPGVTLRLVQPNIEQREKWRPELRARHFARHLRLSEGAAAAGITHVIWPEAATPFLLTESPEALRQIGAVTPAGGATILGTPRRRAADGLYGNAVVTVSHRGKIGEIYDKHHLVPFGEYIPFENWLPLERLAAGRGSFAPGAGPRSVAVPGAPPFSPLVCYEAIFPRKVAASDNRPGWLLNVTNDAWFGKSDGPFQHLSIARLRSIEEGLPMVRVANTGVSAAIDPYGRIIDRLGLGETGVLDIQLPRPVASPLYANAGDGSFVLILLFFFSSYAFQARRKR